MLTNPGPFVTKDRSDGMGELRGDIDERLMISGFTGKSNALSERLSVRLTYYHQQLFFVMLFVLIATYFLGISFYTMVYYFLVFVYRMIKKCIMKIYGSIKDCIKGIIDKKHKKEKENKKK